MAYATYSFYTNTYLGSRVPEAAFPEAAERASEILDALTFERIGEAEAASDAVQRACCALAEMSYAYAERGSGIKSESVGSHRVDYAASASEPQKHAEYRAVAARYLANTGLMYRGRYRDDE